MNHHRLLSGTFAFIVGIIGVIGLLAALSVPVAAQPNAAWQTADLGHVSTAQNPSSTAAAIDPVDSSLSLPPLDWPVTIPPTHSLPYRGSGSISTGVARSSTSPVYHAGFKATRGSGPAPSFLAGHAASLTDMDPRAAANLGSLELTERSMPESSQASSGAPLAPPMPGSADLAICLDTDRAWGVVSAGETVTVAVDTTQMGASLADAQGFFWTTLYNGSGARPDLTAKAVTIYHGASSASVTLHAISGQVDPLTNIVSGVIGSVSSPISVTVYVPGGEPSMSSYSQTVSSNAAGYFAADFSGLFDLHATDEAVVAYVQNGVEVHRHVYPLHSLFVGGWWQEAGGYAPPNTTVTVTVYLSDTMTVKDTVTLTANPTSGSYYTNFGTDVLESDIVVVNFADGAVLSRTMASLTEMVDAVNDRAVGQAQPNAVLLGVADELTSEGWRTVRINTTADASGVYTLNFGGLVDIMPGKWAGVYFADPAGNDLNIWQPALGSIEVNQTWNEVAGISAFPPPLSDPQTPVTLTVYSAVSDSEAIFNALSQPWGWYSFNSTDFPSMPDIVPGDVITVENGLWQGVVHVMTMTVQVNVEANQFTGTVVSPTQRVELSGNYNQPQLYPTNGQFALPGTASDSFAVTPDGFDVRGDLSYEVAHRVAGDYLERISRGTDVLGAVIQWNAFGGIINPPGTSYTVTLYAAGGGFKAQKTGESSQPAGNIWDDFGSTGQQMEPGDHLQIQSAAGFSYTAELPNIIIHPDVATNVISGYGPANALLMVSVDNQGQGYVPTDGSGRFAVAVDQLQEVSGNGILEWGDNVGISYYDENNSWLYSAFNWPSPDVSVNKWNPSGGQARPGGVIVYAIQYSNWGNGAAENTIITDTLPMYTTYADDTSGATHEIGADGVITWNLETLAPNTDRYFMVTLDVSPSAPSGSAIIPDNCAGIATTSPGDFNSGNDRSCAGPVDVQNDEIEIGVDKWSNPNDPAPGEEFEYTLQACNNRGAAAGPVWLTDTLPLSTTLVRWWPEDQQNNYWTEVSRTGGQLVLYAPGLSGYMCDHVRVRLQIDTGVPAFTTLTNSIVAAVEGDVDLNNNQRTNTIRTSLPRYDVNLNKNTNSAVLVPGGWINYHIDYYNPGNSPVHAWVTDTLPAGTTYQTNSAHEQNGGPLFPPALVADQTVVWDLGTIGVGQGYGFDFSIDIGGALTPGTVLTNCATIGLPVPDDSPWDNTSCVAETINSSGPNLRVIKRSNWESNYQQLRYDAQFQNVGDQSIDNVWLTDTLPAATTSTWWNMGFDWSRLASNSQSSNELRWEFSTLYPGDSGGLFFGANLNDPTARPSWYTNTIEIDTPPGDVTPADNHYLDGSFSGEVNRVELRVANRIDMWGQAQPNSPLTITTPSTEVMATVRGDGNWNIYQEGSSIQPGDTITVTAGNGTLPVVIQVPAPFDVQADSITDRVWGQIDALDQQLIDVDLYGYLTKIAQTDGSGNFTRFFADVPRGGNGEVRYSTTIDSTDVVFHRDFQSPDLILTVNSSYDWVETNYASGHTIWITVTDGVGAIKATMVDTTTIVPWWGGGTGFSTNMGTWLPSQPDIAPGDWVYGALDNGYTSSVRMGTIVGNLDLAGNSIAGTVTADWFAQALNAQCWIDNVNNSNQDFTVNPSGGAYTCDFAAVWDLVPGQNVNVQYQEPDGDWVRTVFRGPTPHVKIQKQGNGSPGEGGGFAFRIYYENNGDGAAENTVITDTLLYGMTYLTDTTGLPHIGSGAPGDPLVWQMGTLPNGTSGWFDLFVQITATAGEQVTNTAQIATSNPYDEYRPWEYNNGWGKESWWWADVQASNANVNVGAGTWTWQPAPGYNYIYNANVCNNGSTGTTEVTLTNTLPLSTSLVSWWGQNPGWSQVLSATHQLIVSRPTLVGGQCEQVFVRVHLDPAAMFNDPLHYNVQVGASNAGNNQNDVWHNVGGPYYDLSISKNWNWGQLVPGGEVRYNLSYNNNGSLPITTTIRITDTLPQNTTFLGAWHYDQQGPHPVTPTTVTAGYVVWEIPSLENGFGNNFEIALRLGASVTPGTVFTNCATIAVGFPEYNNPYDNEQCVADTVRANGPNLRVTKTAEWQSGGNQIQYRVRLENIGTTSISDVTVTDTYPSSLTLNWWNINWQPWRFNDDALNHVLTLTLDSPFDPGQTADLNMQFNVSGVAFGTRLTNLAEITTPPGDVNPADNSVQQVSGVGPDLSVEKWLTGGSATPRPGELLTYTLHLANKSSQWGTSGQMLITDTLPAGLEFISALQRLCGPGNFFCENTPPQSGSVLTWTWGSWCPNCWNDLILTVRVANTAQAGDVLTNTAQIASDNPTIDVEPDYTNNRSAVTVRVLNPQFVVGKVYQGDRVAGTVITYTLTVTNQGNYTGTNVRLIDQLPAAMAYGGSGGTYGGGWITWTLPSVNPFGGTATAWFSGTLACTAGAAVSNQNYRVESSDQGVTSTNGSPVSFAIAAPAITVSLTHGPEPAIVNGTILFTATTGTNGTPLSYAWNFGDGLTAGGLTASHVYTHDGSYTAIFTATDACNFTRVQTSTVTVNPPTINANFNQSATTVVVSTTVSFTDTSTTNVPPLAAWEWDFGDGTPHTFTQNASHTFMTPGVRTVRLIVTDTLGYSAFHTSTVTVNPPTINANFNQSATSVVVNGTVRFTDTSSTDGPPLVAWGWNFGDGSLSTTQHPAHIYTTIGSYTVTLQITDSLGYTATRSVTNAVIVQPLCTSLTNVAFTFAPIKPLIHRSVAFTATITPIGATPPLTYVWNFGDSSVVTNTVPTVQHTYQMIGTQTASVTAYNACTPQGVSAQQAITIESYRLFLPLALKN